MKLTLKRILIILIIICTFFPMLFSGIVLGTDNIVLTQERAGNYVSNFAINFYENWSKSDSRTETKTRYTPNPTRLPDETDTTYVLNEKIWIDFVYSNALSLSQVPNSCLPSQDYSNNRYYEKIEVADLKNVLLTENVENEDDDVVVETITELVNTGKIRPGDILFTTEGDYLLFVGGTKVIYSTNPENRNTGALEYTYIQSYLINIKREKEKQHENEEGYVPVYGITEIYRITQQTLDNWNITDAHANVFFNNKGFISSNIKYSGIPTQQSYTGSTHFSLLNFIFDGLASIAKFLINLTLYLARAVIVGWVNIIETLIQTIVLKLTGNSNPVGFVDKISGVSTTSYAGDRITVESLFYNRVPITDANFFNFETAGGFDLINENGEPVSWIYSLRQRLATWYVILRDLSIGIMLIILIYVGIRMAISTLAERKAKYKKMLLDWVIAILIVLFIHLFMYLVLNLNDYFVNMFRNINIEFASIIIGNAEQELTLYDAIRTKAYSFDFFDGTVGVILYIIVIYFLVRFLLVYLKRMISIYILGLMGTVVGAKYAFDKATGRKSNTLGKWIKEFIFNVLLQTIHCLVYTVFMAVALSIAFESIGGIIIAILTLQLLLQSDKLIMKMFGVKGTLLDDVNKPPENYFSFIAKARFYSTVATLPFAFGKKMIGGVLSGDNGAFNYLRYVYNYKAGDTDKDVQKKMDLQEYKIKSAIAGSKLGEAYFKAARTLVPIKFVKENIDRRRELYKTLGNDKVDYELKRTIAKSLQLEKSLKKKRFKRSIDAAVSTGSNFVKGAFNAVAAVGMLSEGFVPAIHRAATSYGQFTNGSSDNVNIYNRAHPDERLAGGSIGAAQIANDKIAKDLKKLRDKETDAQTIAQYEKRLYELAEELKEDEVDKKSIRETVVKTKATFVSGRQIIDAVNRYTYSNAVGEKLNEEDLDGILDILEDDLKEANSKVVLDGSMRQRIKDTILSSGISLNGKNNKQYGQALQTAMSGDGVVPVATRQDNDKLNEVSKLLKEIHKVNQSNIIKNKESVVSEAKIRKNFMEVFKEVQG